MADTAPGYLSAIALPDLVEAAVHAGQPHVAATAAKWLTDIASTMSTPLACGVDARARALLASNDHADTHFAHSLDELRASRSCLEYMRTHLVYGEWLRRQRRRREAWAHLRTAYDAFTSMGGSPSVHAPNSTRPAHM